MYNGKINELEMRIRFLKAEITLKTNMLEGYTQDLNNIKRYMEVEKRKISNETALKIHEKVFGIKSEFTSLPIGKSLI